MSNMNILAIGSHPDDMELGCAGTLIKHVAAGDDVTMLVVSDGQSGPGDVARRREEQLAAAEMIGAHVLFGEFPDGQVSLHELDLVHTIENAIKQTGATRVYTHNEQDTHQDHRAVARASLGAGRHVPQLLTYESPSSYGLVPVVFTDITDSLEKKVAALECHGSQVEASRMASPELVRSAAGYHGHQARVTSAEGFMVHRLVMEI